MPQIDLKLDGDNAWPDLADKTNVTWLEGNTGKISVAVLDGGMASGRPSVAIRIDTAENSVVVAETSARLFCTIGKAIMAKYPDLFNDPNG